MPLIYFLNYSLIGGWSERSFITKPKKSNLKKLLENRMIIKSSKPIPRFPSLSNHNFTFLLGELLLVIFLNLNLLRSTILILRLNRRREVIGKFRLRLLGRLEFLFFLLPLDVEFCYSWLIAYYCSFYFLDQLFQGEVVDIELLALLGDELVMDVVADPDELLFSVASSNK